MDINLGGGRGGGGGGETTVQPKHLQKILTVIEYQKRIAHSGYLTLMVLVCSTFVTGLRC